MQSAFLRPVWSLLVLGALLAGCGGGGGGGAGGASNSGVTVGSPSPASINQKMVVGSVMPNVTLRGVVTGNVASLNGKTIFVVVEDPASLYLSNASAIVFFNGIDYRYELYLSGRTQSAIGYFTGNLRVFACLDAACAQRLGGIPLVLPYDVTVEEPITLSTNTINISVPFGTQPAAQAVTVNWFSGASGWVATNTTPGLSSSHHVTASTAPDVHTLLIGAKMAPPGTYVETIGVRTNASSLPDKTITVNYTVTPSALDYVFAPASLHITRSASDPLIAFHEHQVLFSTDVSFTQVHINYLSGTSATGPVNNWWNAAYWNSSAVCTGNGSGSYSCLQPGTYTAEVVYTLNAPSGTYDAAFPITLTVTP